MAELKVLKYQGDGEDAYEEPVARKREIRYGKNSRGQNAVL